MSYEALISPQDATEGTTWTCSGGCRGGKRLSVVCSVTTCQGGGEAGCLEPGKLPQPCLLTSLPPASSFTRNAQGPSRPDADPESGDLAACDLLAHGPFALTQKLGGLANGQ